MTLHVAFDYELPIPSRGNVLERDNSHTLANLLFNLVGQILEYPQVPSSDGHFSQLLELYCNRVFKKGELVSAY